MLELYETFARDRMHIKMNKIEIKLASKIRTLEVHTEPTEANTP